MSMQQVGNAFGSAASTAANSAASAASSAVNHVSNKVVSYETGTVLKILRFLNILNAVGLVATGVVNLLDISSCSGSQCVPITVVSIQLCIFGTMLFLYETRMGQSYDVFFRTQFGFLYGQYGRLFFILFLASLCFGIVYTSLPYWWVQTFVGAFTIANSWVNCVVIRNHPGFAHGKNSDENGLDVEQASLPPPSQPSSANMYAAQQHHDAPPPPPPSSNANSNPFAMQAV